MTTTNISSNEVANLIKNKEITIIDVRTHQEFIQGHIKNSINICISDSDFQDRMANLDTNNTYLIYCRSGARSLFATQIMEKLGFKNLYNLANGLIEWQFNNFKLVK